MYWTFHKKGESSAGRFYLKHSVPFLLYNFLSTQFFPEKVHNCSQLLLFETNLSNIVLLTQYKTPATLYIGSLSQGSEHPRLFRSHFAPPDFRVLSGINRFLIYMKTGFKTGFQSRVLEKSRTFQCKLVLDPWKLVLKLVNTGKYSKK